jgi:hypothetical protein
MAWTTHWLHIATIPGINQPDDALLSTLHAYRTFCIPAFTIPLTGVVIGLGPHVETCWDQGRLHSAGSPAWHWPTSEAIWSWRGTRVPEWVITDPTTSRIAAEANTEIRRCAIESLGWERYLSEIGAIPVSTEADPGNPGHQLHLYDVPDARQLYGGDVRVLVMQNASLDRDGKRRTFAETVPSTCRTAIEAAAWQFDLTPDTYRERARAT